MEIPRKLRMRNVIVSLRFNFVYKKMVYSVYVKERILILATQGFKPPTIQKILAEERFYVTREGVHKFITKFNESGSLLRCPGSGRPSKTTLEVKRVVEEQMRLDDKTTAYQLHALLNAKGYFLSIHTIFRCRSALVWWCRPFAWRGRVWGT